MQLRTHSPEETLQLAQKLVQDYPAQRIWLLEGELAAGKTQLVKGLAKALGVDSEITSPTFAYLNEYGDKLAHYDLYRLEGPDEELIQILLEHFETKDYVVVEWPSRMNLHLGKPHLKIDLSHEGGNDRAFKVTPHS